MPEPGLMTTDPAAVPAAPVAPAVPDATLTPPVTPAAPVAPPVTVTIPGEGATPEELAAFHTALGVPSAVEGYTFDALPEAVAAVPGSSDLDTGFRQVALDAKLSPVQAAKVRAGYLELLGKMPQPPSIAEVTAGLQKTWGADYEANVTLANKPVQRFADPGMYKEMEEAGLTNHPVMIRFLAKVGAALSEDRTPGINNPSFISPDAAKAEIAKMNQDKQHPYWIQGHPDHKAAVEAMKRLYQTAYPTASPQ